MTDVAAVGVGAGGEAAVRTVAVAAPDPPQTQTHPPRPDPDPDPTREIAEIAPDATGMTAMTALIAAEEGGETLEAEAGVGAGAEGVLGGIKKEIASRTTAGVKMGSVRWKKSGGMEEEEGALEGEREEEEALEGEVIGHGNKSESVL